MGCKEQKGNGNKVRKVRQIIQTRALCARLKLSHLVTFRLKRREKSIGLSLGRIILSTTAWRRAS